MCADNWELRYYWTIAVNSPSEIWYCGTTCRCIGLLSDHMTGNSLVTVMPITQIKTWLKSKTELSRLWCPLKCESDVLEYLTCIFVNWIQSCVLIFSLHKHTSTSVMCLYRQWAVVTFTVVKPFLQQYRISLLAWNLLR